MALALHALTTLRAYGGERGSFGGGYGGRGGGYGGRGGGGGNQEQMREAKRSREASQFFSYQRRLCNTGLPPRSEEFWNREEAALFKTAHVSAGINFEKYNDIPVDCTGGQGDEKPVASFQEACEKFNLPELLSASIDRCGYSTPTPVQKYSLPASLGGTDVMVSAQTGSGKTAAFLVPIVSTALRAGAKPLEEGAVCPTSVVLAPTRELCQQIAQEARRLCFRTPIRTACIYGGADAMPQLKALAEGAEIVICTPGRLDDFLGRGVISMKQVKYLALDEADRMLDMGFEPQIRSIIEEHGMPASGVGESGRQTMMFSATFPQEMQDMALDFLDPSYLWICVGRVGSTTSNVEQRFEDASRMDGASKFDALKGAIKAVEPKDGGSIAKTIVFANQKAVVDDVVWQLSDQRIRAAAIHGGLTQPQRDRSISDLKSGRVSVLVATDVAARGLDLPGIDHVINYDLPLNAEDYVHRIGRTGRIGNKGIATSFVGSREGALRDIVKGLREGAEEDDSASPVPAWLEDQVQSNHGSGPMNRFRSRERSYAR